MGRHYGKERGCSFYTWGHELVWSMPAKYSDIVICDIIDCLNAVFHVRQSLSDPRLEIRAHSLLGIQWPEYACADCGPNQSDQYQDRYQEPHEIFHGVCCMLLADLHI